MAEEQITPESRLALIWFNRSHREGYATICGNLFILSLSTLVGHFFGSLPLEPRQVWQLCIITTCLLAIVHLLRKGKQ
ncbi:MAG: hypothetical protein ORN98_11610 [Alphaproteobacteria bacterium]|nr:hypothetical protein [Alphaproteobacteria bacterium]